MPSRQLSREAFNISTLAVHLPGTTFDFTLHSNAAQLTWFATAVSITDGWPNLLPDTLLIAERDSKQTVTNPLFSLQAIDE